MDKYTKLIALFFIGVCLFFFYQIFLGKIPFPGDLLIAEYSPWKYFSFLGYAPGGFPEKFQYFDVLRQIYPWTILVINSLRNGIFPLWNPYNFSGSPLFANSQSAVLYPLHLLYFLLPVPISWTILIMLQPLLTSIFTYCYARQIGMKKSGSIIAAVAFSYSLFATVFLEYNTFGQVILFLPLLLFLSELLFKKKKWWISLLFIASFASCCFAGHLQLFGFVSIFTAVYIFCKILVNADKRVNFIFFGILFLLGFGVSAIQLFPTIELINNAARSAQDYQVIVSNFLIQPYQLLLFFAPDLFGNPATKNYLLIDSYPGNALSISIAPLLLAMISLKKFRKNWYISFFSIASFILLLLFVRSPLSEVFYKIHIPFFSTGSPANAIFLLSFSLSILSGFGLDYINNKKWVISILVVSFLILLFGIGSIKVLHIAISTKNLFYSVIIYFFSLILFTGIILNYKNTKKFFTMLLIILIIVDLFYFFQKFNPFVQPKIIYPQTPIISFLQQHDGYDRFWSYGAAFIESNISSIYQLYDIDGYDPLYPRWYGQFIQASSNGKIPTIFTDATRSDAELSQNPKSTFAAKIRNLLGVKYIVDRVENNATEQTFPINQYKLVYSQDGWKIYKNLFALPRAFIAYTVQSYYGSSEFGQLFFSNTFNPQRTLLMSHKNYSKPGKGQVKIMQYQPNKVVIRTQSTVVGFLFLSDTYFPGWIARVDGKQTTIFQTDYAFRSIEIPKGNHIVVFSYQPFSFILGLFVTIISSTLAVIFAVILRKNGK